MNDTCRVCRCITAALAISLILLASCDKVPINGVLDGMWQLTSIHTPDSTVNTSTRQLFVSFQLHLTQWEKKSVNRIIYAHFRHDNDSICFTDFADHARHDLSEGDDDRIFSPAEMAGGAMAEWGVRSADARYRVLELNHKSLILQAADTVLTFRKF